MADVLSPEQRKYNMSSIRGSDTKPEMIVRRGLHARGLRYRLHDRKLPGRPDLVFPRYNAVIFIHGCFWHGHKCPMFRMPSTRQEFWSSKISTNQNRDAKVHNEIINLGWRILTIWECSLKGPAKFSTEFLLDECLLFLHGDFKSKSITGNY